MSASVIVNLTIYLFQSHHIVMGPSSLAEQFTLSLGSMEPLVAKTGASAVCLVTSASLQFATDIREKVRFAVTRRIGPNQVKQKVANRQDLCCLSQDQKQFKFGFDLQSSGIYKVGQ